MHPIIEENKDSKNLLSNEALTSNQLNQMEEFLGSAVKQGQRNDSLMSPTNNGKFFFNNNLQGGAEDGITGVIRDFEELDASIAPAVVELPLKVLQN